nr:hypothetical protein BaRGS_005380 [Batillaria attramentaria]
MKLSPREIESLLVHQAGSVAQKRLARGVKLNHPETVALIASVLQELVRDGHTVSDLMEKGKALLGNIILNENRRTVALDVVSLCDRPIQIRLGDTNLILEVEKDYTVYGDECKFGGGKVLREGMGQAASLPASETLDTVITNALIVDAVTGVVKADVGIKVKCQRERERERDGMIVGIGKAGNPDVMEGVQSNMIVGACTEAIAGEGLILTAGALDGHVHFICPQLAKEAIASGITTMFGGGTGPATGSNATTCTPGPNHIRFMLQSTDAFPLNFGFTGKGNTSFSAQKVSQDLEDQLLAGAMGMKLHEDWGSTPVAIDTCLRAAEEFDVPVMIHTDTLNESACVEDTLEVFKGRTIHTYHSEGAGGGHAPDILRVVSVQHVLPSSTNPTRPYTTNTIDEHLDMLMVAHHLDKRKDLFCGRNLPEDVAFAESRIRAGTIAAEDILQDMGAISMISSDAQAMGRIGEVISRTWQTADKMKHGDNDNLRIKRYVAKYTINPAITHGMAHLIGSVQTAKLADLVLWKPAFFGAKPEIVIKGGQIAWAQMGMPNASIPTPEPVKQRKMYGAYGKAVGPHSVVFVSKGLGKALGYRVSLQMADILPGVIPSHHTIRHERSEKKKK